MLLFSTVLSINKSMTKDDFIKLVIEWNQGSPHKEDVIENINWNGERNIRFGDEFLWCRGRARGTTCSAMKILLPSDTRNVMRTVQYGIRILS